jgi:hypothetical protein
MNKALEVVINKVKALPDIRQREAAEILDLFVSSQDSDEVYVLSEEEERLIQEALDDPRPMASEAEVRAVFDKYR